MDTVQQQQGISGSKEAIAMSKTIIHQVVGIDGNTLLVFHTEAHCWQFRLISPGGAVFGERKIYYSAEAVFKAGLKWIAWGSQIGFIDER